MVLVHHVGRKSGKEFTSPLVYLPGDDGLGYIFASKGGAPVEFITGPLLDVPRRIGKPLRDELRGLYSAGLGTQWRVVYRIDESKHTVTVEDIRLYRSHRFAVPR